MSYLARLKEKISQDAPKSEANKGSKAPFLPLLAPTPAPLRDISMPDDLNQLIERVGRAYRTPESEYDEIRLAAMRDLDGALQSYRLIARELDAGHIDDGMVEERHRCLDSGHLTQRGRCLAAQRGEIDYVATFEPVQDVLRRCEKFKLKGPSNGKTK